MDLSEFALILCLHYVIFALYSITSRVKVENLEGLVLWEKLEMWYENRCLLMQ